MKFQNGHKLSKGRPIGSLNKRTAQALAILERENFCPVTALIECYKDAKKVYDNYGVIYDAILEAKEEQAREKGYVAIPPEDKADKYLKIAADIAKDLTSYAYPKLKAIEQSKGNPTEGMTPQEKLEAARLMVKALEMEVKDDPQPGAS